jgi:phosphonate transport system substrate-binding protein
LLAVAVAWTACSGLPFDEVELDFAERTPTSAPRPARGALRFALAAMLTPKEASGEYSKLVRELGRGLGRPIELVFGRDYHEVNSLLLARKLDMAFVCTGGYIDLLRHSREVPILAVPVVRGKLTYRSLVIARAESRARSFADLRGARFAFTDPLSNTGYLYPSSRVRALGSTRAEFFSASSFVGSHDRAIHGVQRQLYDAAAVDALVFDHLAQHRPEAVAGLRVLETSPEFGIPPVVAAPSTTAAQRAGWQAALLELHRRPAAAEVLRRLAIDRFALAPDGLYSSAERLWEAAR